MPKVTVYAKNELLATIDIPFGENLLKALLTHQVSPYTKYTEKLNCSGRGICATCGVYILSNQQQAIHWHDQLAKKFHYPRLTCQLKVEDDLTIELPEKQIWGNRRKPN